MKLIYIANGRIPTEKAHGYQITKMCEQFAEQGAEVELWAPTRKNTIRDDVFTYYGVKRNFSVKYIACFDFISFDRLLFRKSVYLESLWFLIKLAFQKIPKDAIIYTRNPELVWFFNLRGIKIAYECHDWFNDKKKIALWFLRRSDYIITTNNFIKKEFIDNGFKNIFVAPNGVNLEIFDIDASKEEAISRLDISDDTRKRLENKKMLLYTGSYRTMGVDKGIGEILKALEIINRPDVIFAAVGGNDIDISYYEKRAFESGVGNSCIFLGRTKQSELALWQKASAILLMPFPDKAHYRYHMTPLKTFEYMASGRLIIASDLPSIREILSDETAVFCKPGDEKDLAEKILFVLESGDVIQKIPASALLQVKQYAWSNRAGGIINLINKK